MSLPRSVVSSCLGVVLWSGSVRAAPLVLEQEADLIRIENAWAKYEIDVSKGAKISSFVLKSSGREWTFGGPNSGLFIDHVWQQSHPGELQNSPYEVELVEHTEEQAVLAFRRSLRSERDESVSQVRVARTMTFRADTPAVKAVVRLSNPAHGYKRLGFWQQHCFGAGGDKANVFYFRPTTIGIKVATHERTEEGWRRRGEDFVKDPVAGWTATTDSETTEGAVFLMDYNYLKWLYNCTPCWTTEYFYDRVTLPPGGTWETEQYFMPTCGYDGFSHADRHILAHVYAKGDSLVVKLGSSTETARNVEATLKAVAYPDGNVLLKEDFRIAELSFDPQQKTFSVAELSDRPVLVKLDLAGGTWTSAFETFLAPGVSPFEVVATRVAHRVPKPDKVKTYAFPPQPPSLPERLSVLYLKGIHADSYRVEEAVAEAGGVVTKKSFYTSNVYGNRMDYLPALPAEMFKYSLVVVGNIDYEALGTDFSAYLEYFLQHGGALLVLGGGRAFGRGQYKGTRFDALLPVDSGETFDLLPAANPLALRPAAGVSWLGEYNWSQQPVVLWSHRPASLRDGAAVLVEAEGVPFLVEHAVGKGRAAVLLGAVLGGGGEGTLFWEWDEWPGVLARVLCHLVDRSP